MKSRSMLSLLIVAAAALAASQTALAQGVGNLGSLPTQFSSPVPIFGWTVDSGNANNPWIPVQIDPNGPSWVKTFSGSNGQPFTAVPGQTFSFQEFLVIAPTQSWTDWHERILTPGWQWIQPTAFLVNGTPAPGLTTVITPGGPTAGGVVDFYFNPLAPGTQIIVRKVLEYVGQPGAAFYGTVQIEQYPTPEPASLLTLLGGGLVMLRRRFALGRSSS